MAQFYTERVSRKEINLLSAQGVEGDKRSAITVKEQDLFASFSNQGQTVRGAFTRLPLVAAQSLQTHRLKENKRPDAIKDGIAVV